MSDQTAIRISKSNADGLFPPVAVTQSQLVFWKNEDSEAHWPLLPLTPHPPTTSAVQTVGPRFQTGPGDTSDPVQPYASGTGIVDPPVIIKYSCKLHKGESGEIRVVADFLSRPSDPKSLVLNQLPDATFGAAYGPEALTSGGLPPFSHSLSNAAIPEGMNVTDKANGVFVTGTPRQTGVNFAFTVHCEDSLKNAVDQTYTIIVKTAGGTVS